MDNVSFIGNSADSLPLFFFVFVYFMFILICMQITPISQGNNIVGKTLRYIDHGLRYNFVIRLIIEVYLDMSINAILNIAQASRDSNGFDIFLAILALQTNCFMIAFCLCFILINTWKIRNKPEKLARYNCLFSE
jgi:hypothetical protein